MNQYEMLELNDVLESPIERRLVGSLLAGGEIGLRRGVLAEVNIRFLVRQNRADELPGIRDAERYPGFWLHIFPQEPVGPYRVDFLAIAAFNGRAKTLIIECDGKEFHQDWEKDFDRDMYMRRLKYGVIRLKGTDIHCHPTACRKHIFSVALNLLEEEESDLLPKQKPLYPDTMRPFCEVLKAVFHTAEWNWLAEYEARKADKSEEDGDA